jgi:hypothetical protein
MKGIYVDTMTVQEATETMRDSGMKISPETLRLGLRQGVFPFGYFVETPDGKPVYCVYTKKLREWLLDKGAMVEDDGR